jgi:hypothetical protein
MWVKENWQVEGSPSTVCNHLRFFTLKHKLEKCLKLERALEAVYPPTVWLGWCQELSVRVSYSRGGSIDLGGLELLSGMEIDLVFIFVVWFRHKGV